MGLEWRKKKRRHGRIVSDRHAHPLVLEKFAKSRLFFSFLHLGFHLSSHTNELYLKVLIKAQTPKPVSPPILQQYHKPKVSFHIDEMKKNKNSRN
jgi:hypothetical protein